MLPFTLKNPGLFVQLDGIHHGRVWHVPQELDAHMGTTFGILPMVVAAARSHATFVPPPGDDSGVRDADAMALYLQAREAELTQSCMALQSLRALGEDTTAMEARLGAAWALVA